MQTEVIDWKAESLKFEDRLSQAVGLAISNREQAKMKKMLYDAQVLANKVPNDRQDLSYSQ